MFEVSIKPEDIDKFVKDAFMECAIGKQLKDGIQKSFNELFNSYRNPVQEFVKEEIKKLVCEYLKQEDVKPKIMAAIAKGITPEIIELMISNAAYELQKKINEKSYD